MLEDSHEWTLYRAQMDLTGQCAVRAIREQNKTTFVVGAVIIAPVMQVATTYRTPPPPGVKRELAAEKRRYRKQHWSHRFQAKFSRWLSTGHHADEMVVLGYTRDQLREHLQRQMPNGMTWGQYAGFYAYRARRRMWVVDHIVPKRLFRADEVAAAYALTNLRPLCMDKNIRKGGTREHLL